MALGVRVQELGPVRAGRAALVPVRQDGRRRSQHQGLNPLRLLERQPQRYAAAERCFEKAVRVAPKKTETLAAAGQQSRDFRKLMEGAELHAGLIVIVPNVTPALQRELFAGGLQAVARLADMNYYFVKR